MTDAIDLTKEQRNQLTVLLRRFLPDVAVWAYGSRVKWTARPNSDLDLVAFTTPAQRSQVADLKDALAESNLPFPVDLNVWDEVPERFREIIRKEYVVVQVAKEQLQEPSMVDKSSAIHIPSTASQLPDDWRWERLDELCDGIFDCPHSTPVMTADGPLVVRSQDMRTGVFRMEDAGHVSEDTYQERIVRAEPKYGDLFYSREGTYFGIAAEVPAGVRVCLGQRMVLLRPKPTRCHSRFLRFWLNSPVMASHTHGHRDGTVAERLNLPTIRQLPVAVPPLDTQRAIAHILGTLDDKIELNRCMNETLEAMARALFKSWFVDFDPVRAKAEGRDPGLPKHIADFFPSHLVDSELGKIPEGWNVGPLDRALVLQRGFDLPATQRTSGTYPVLAASGPSGTHNEFMVRGPGVTTGRSGVLGKVFYVHDDFWPLNTSLWVKEFRHSTPAYAFHLLHGLDFGLFNAGSAVPTLNRNHVHNLSTLLPPMGLIRAFERVAAASLKRQKHNDDQSQTVVSLRDTLLPKLISGELSVKDRAHLVLETNP